MSDQSSPELERDIVIINRHRVWIEEPFALVIEADGDITGPDFRQMREVLALVGGGEGPVVIMQNLSKAGAFSGAARKDIMEDKRTERVKSVICIGAGFQMRVFMGMILKALKVFRPEIPPVFFAANESEGRNMLHAERQRVGQTQPGHQS